MMRIDVATAHENRPKSVIARVRDEDADALAASVAHLEDADAVAYRVVDDEDDEALGTREEPAVDEKGRAVQGIGEWTFTTAGELEAMKPAAIIKAATSAPKAKGKKR